MTNNFEKERVKRIEAGPYWKLIGMKVLKYGPRHATLHMRVSQNVLQSEKILHGGVVCSIVDAAIAIALISDLKPSQATLTVELKVNFIASVSDGELTAQAKIVHRGSTIAVGEVDVHSGNRLVAKGLGTYIIRGRRK